MASQDNEILTRKSGFKMEKKVKYSGATLTNTNSKLFQNNFVPVWNDIKKTY